MQSFDEMPPVCMGGKLGMTKSMNISINLANPSHYDVQDLGVGVAMWMEMDPTKKTDVYFVFPNLVVKDKNKCTHYGVLVKLCDRCMISWDGALLQHCTLRRKIFPSQYWSKHEKPSIGTFASFHVAHNGPKLSKMHSIRQLQYEERMLDNADYEGFKIFAEKVVNGEIVDFW